MGTVSPRIAPAKTGPTKFPVVPAITAAVAASGVVPAKLTTALASLAAMVGWATTPAVMIEVTEAVLFGSLARAFSALAMMVGATLGHAATAPAVTASA